MKKLMMRGLTWAKANKLEVLVLSLVIAISIFLRLYRISDYMTFLGDEGRDAIIVKGILVNHHLPLLGPPTSIGNMYLGPLYYYMMAVAMAVSWLNPVAAAVMVAFVGTAAVIFIYYLSREWFGRVSAVIGSILYSLSPVNLFYSRSSWNPNPAPFFALLSIFGFYKARKSGNYLWLILSGGGLAFALQMHYLALILLPVFAVLWLYELICAKRTGKKLKNFLPGTILAIVVFLFLMSPLAIFDVHHNYMNLRAISTFFGDRQTTVNLNLFNTLSRVVPIYGYNLIGRYVAGENTFLMWLVSVLVLVPVFRFAYLWFKKKVFSWPLFVLSCWLVIGVIGLSLYKQTLFDHYLGFLNPVPYLLLGAVFDEKILYKFKVQRKGFLLGAIVLGLVLAIFNLQKSPLNDSPHYELKRTQEVARYLIQRSDGQPFNFALLSAHNYDSAYQFYLDLYGDAPKKVPFVITDQLFVVCEDPVCTPINNPKYEIAAFGWSKIVDESELDGVRIYKLVHNVPIAEK